MLLKWDLRPGGCDSRMFWGFRSRWMIPLACRTRMAPAICCRNTRMVSSLSVPLAAAARFAEGAARVEEKPIKKKKKIRLFGKIITV